MAKDRLHLKTVIAMKEIFIMVFSMELENLLGRMELCMKASLLTIELLAKEYISGPMEAFMKEK